MHSIFHLPAKQAQLPQISLSGALAGGIYLALSMISTS
jgi:hypothetical protein